MNQVDLVSWLEARLDTLVDGWVSGVRYRDYGRGEALNELVDRFLPVLVAFLPRLVGPLRDEFEPLWMRAAELYGTAAASRGLAAGEVIEEFQAVRELVIRELYRDPPLGGKVPLGLREILRLNRAIDAGVTFASVGHTDALFFQLLEGEDREDPRPAEDAVQGIREQLEQIRDELQSLTAEPQEVGGR